MSRDLIIPIYVDTNALLDLLASIEGGFSVVEKVSTQHVSRRNAEHEGRLDAGTEFGIPNVLNLLKVNLGFLGTYKRATEQTQAQETERYHTYGSLFYRLREYLEDEGLIKRINNGMESWQSVQPSDFIEIHGLLQPNPLASSLQLLDRLVTIAELATTAQSDDPPSQESQGHHNRRKGKQNVSRGRLEDKQEAANKHAPQIHQIRQFLQGLLADLQNDAVRLFIIESTEAFEYRSVVALFIEYLRDKTMTELNNKEFHLLGKVVRKIEQDTNDSIDLLIGTALGGVGDNLLQQLTGGLSSIEAVKLPKIETHIAGPALEIVPVAIYV